MPTMNWSTALSTMQKLEDLIKETGEMEPSNDCEAHVHRELLAALDRSHDMLVSLIVDAKQEK